MSSNNSLSYKRAARILTVACGLLFSIFSIVYLFVLQKDVVGALHYSLSQGSNYHYSCFIGIPLGNQWIDGIKGACTDTFLFPVLSVAGSADGCGPDYFPRRKHRR